MQDRCPVCHEFTELGAPQPDALDFCTSCGSILRTRVSRRLRGRDGRALFLIEPILRPATVTSQTVRPTRRASGSALATERAAVERFELRPLTPLPRPPRLTHQADTRLIPQLMFVASVALGVLVTCGWYVLVQGIFRLAGH
jgi:hypothetical protein